jgi:serine protease Do
MNKSMAVFAASLFLAVATLGAAEDRRERVLNDRKEVEAAGHWIYNDLPGGLAEAARTGKPLLVVFRCVP